MQSSKCATQKEKEYLYKLLGNKRFFTVLLFCGSMHGWMAEDFHSRCDGKGPLVSLFKMKDGDCIGGYTKAQFSSPYPGQWFVDPESLIFNLGQQ